MAAKQLPAWWRSAVVYEVYPRSFADGNDDGQGDLKGLVERLPYLAGLGVDALWIAPWYSSPMADGGYDVADYRDIHPMFGSLTDAEVLIGRAHELGLRVVIDLVANHTSREHPWFEEALAAEPGSFARNRYFFRDGRGPGGSQPPNNWISAFGGSAWTRTTAPDGTPGQWYLHTFAPEQPDLDWSSPEVGDEFDTILRFWLDRGVDGFRVDAAPAMAKPPGLPDAEHADQASWSAATWVGHPQWDTDGLHDIFRRWRRVLDDRPGDRLFVAEALVNGPERLARFVRPDELHTAFNFTFMHAPWDADALRTVVDITLASLASTGAPATWALSSHDEVRPLTRLAGSGVSGTDLDLGARRARAAALLSLALPGGAYVYQGDELGLPEVEDLPDDVLQDPVFVRSGGRARGRDGCRVPLPWSGEHPPYGFTHQAQPWLPQPLSWRRLTVEAQSGDPDSTLELYRAAIRLRASFRDEPDFAWLGDPADGVLDFRRGERLRCVLNLSAEPVDLPGTPTLWSGHGQPADRLPADTACWFVTSPEGEGSLTPSARGSRSEQHP